MGKKNFADLTTFRVGGEIKHYIKVDSIEGMADAVKFAKKNRLPIFILGGGSDILVSDKAFNGVVIKFVGEKTLFADHGSYFTLTAEAGAVWDSLVEDAVGRGLRGIECLSGIPGTVGGAPIQNIGAYGQELSDVLVSLTAFDIDKQTPVTFSKHDCQFGYRESIFKKKSHWQKYIICDVTIKLGLSTKSNLNKIRKRIIKTRRGKIDDWREFPNAGSFFKNPVIQKTDLVPFLSKYPQMPHFKYGDKYKLSAGWMVEKAGWKGKSSGKVKVSDTHALIITNPGGQASASQIKDFAERIAADVYQKFGITLEPEVQLINF